MDFNDTYIDRRKRRGWTMIELLMVMGIVSILGVVIASVMVFSGKSFKSLKNYIELDDLSRRSLDSMMNDIREATRVTYWSPSSNELHMLDPDNIELKLKYNSATRCLTREWNGKTNTLLTECDRLAFAMFQRSPQAGGGWLWTSSTNYCKLVEVNWSCSRALYSTNYKATANFQTESVQTAKIVIRNEPAL